MILPNKISVWTSAILISLLFIFSGLNFGLDNEKEVYVPGIGDPTFIHGEPTRNSQYFYSTTGGKWVYDFSDIDPLSNSQNLLFKDGVGALKESEELDDFSTGTHGSLPSGWTESDASQGDFLLDSSIFNEAANGVLFSSVSGGGDYGVSHIVPTVASSDDLEIKLSIRIDMISEGTTPQGFAIKVHYTGSTEGPELRLHQNGSLSFFGWDGAQNREHFSQGTPLSSDIWYDLILNINMTSQRCGLDVDGRKEFWNMPMRSASGGNIIFLNTLTFHTGADQDIADIYLDDIFATKNTINTGFYRSPTISKTPMMNWQFLQVYPGQNEDLLSLSLINISNDLPYSSFNSISVPGNGRIDLSSFPNTVSNFRIRVDMERDVDRRPSLDLIGASWLDPLQFFDPLFPGTGLQSIDVDFINNGLTLKKTGPASYKDSGQVTTPLVNLGNERVWGKVISVFDLPSGCNYTMEIISPTSQDRIPGTLPSYNGTLDLEWVHPLDHDGFRIRITLRGDGTSTPTINWLAVSTFENSPPVIDMVSLEDNNINRMDSTYVTFRSIDETDPVVTTDLEYRTSAEGPWIQDMISERSVQGEFTSHRLSPAADDPVGAYELRFSSTDRSEVTTHLQGYFLNVENRVVTQPVIDLSPGVAFTDNIIRVSVTGDSLDPEEDIVRYRFHWFVNGFLVDPSDPGGPAPGWMPSNVSSRESTLSPVFSRSGDNITCRVVPTDLIDDGPAAESWVIINNSPPSGPDNQISFVVEEDTTVTIDLEEHFSDADLDTLTFSLDHPASLIVEELSVGIYNVTPVQDLNGEYLINISATDGISKAFGQVSLTYTPLNDPPTIQEISSRTIKQGEKIELPVIWGDPEDPDISVITGDLPDSWGSDGRCEFDEENSTLVIEAENGNVGSHFFTFIVTDPQGLENRIVFNITVENINDPIEGALILTPLSGHVVKTGEEVEFEGDVIDLDKIHGQEFFYTWVLVTETIGTGRNITYIFEEPGTYSVILEVSEGTGSRSATVEITVEKKDDGGGGGGGGGEDEKSSEVNVLFIVLPSVGVILLGLILIIAFMLSRKKSSVTEEPEEEAPIEDEVKEEPPEEVEEESKEEQIEPPPVPVHEPTPEPEPELIMPSGDDLLMPDDLGSVDIPQIEVPETSKVSQPVPEESDVQYYSPSKK